MILKIDPELCNQKFVPMETVEKVVKLSLMSTLYADVPQNVLIIGPSGCGKTACVRDLAKKLFGTQNLTPGIYTFQDHKYAVLELHGATMDVNTVMVPTIKRSPLIGPEVQQYVEAAAKEKDETLKGIYQTAAQNTMTSVLSYVLDEFFEETVFGGNAEGCFILIQDVNKNADPAFNNFIKSLIDRKIGGKDLPPTCLIMTANPYTSSGVYSNNRIDITVTSASTVLNVQPDKKSAAYWASRRLPFSEKFFKDNPGSLMYEEKETLEGTKNLRNWDAANAIISFILEKKLEDEFLQIIPAMLRGKVGEKDARDYAAYLLSADSGVSSTIVPEDILTNPEKLARAVSATAAPDFGPILNILAEQEPDKIGANIYTFIKGLDENVSSQKTFVMKLNEIEKYKVIIENPEKKKLPKWAKNVQTVYMNIIHLGY